MSNNEILELNKQNWFLDVLTHPIAGEIKLTRHFKDRLFERHRMTIQDLINYFHNFKYIKKKTDCDQVYLYMKHLGITIACDIKSKTALTTTHLNWNIINSNNWCKA
jgi:hypothetical protein